MLKKERKTPFTIVKLGKGNVTENIYALLLPLYVVQIEGTLTEHINVLLLFLEDTCGQTSVCCMSVCLRHCCFWGTISHGSPVAGSCGYNPSLSIACSDSHSLYQATLPCWKTKRFSSGRFQPNSHFWLAIFFVEKLPPAAGGRCCKSNPPPDRNLLTTISYNEIIIPL